MLGELQGREDIGIELVSLLRDLIEEQSIRHGIAAQGVGRFIHAARENCRATATERVGEGNLGMNPAQSMVLEIQRLEKR